MPNTTAAEAANNNALGAEWLWSRRLPITKDSPPWRYLREQRRYTGKIPATLGYLPARGEHSDAMIAAFGLAPEAEPGALAPPRMVAGIHLTRLTQDGQKAPNAEGKAKIMLGCCKGAPIVLAPPNDLVGLAITEGIEDAISVSQATGLAVWAAGAANFMPALADLVPNYIEVITIYAHADPEGQRHARALAEKLKVRRDLEVRVTGTAP